MNVMEAHGHPSQNSRPWLLYSMLLS